MSIKNIINSVSANIFNRDGIIRIPFSSNDLKENREFIIGEFSKKGFLGDLRIGGKFDGNQNSYVLYDLNKFQSSETLKWIEEHSYQTGI